MNCCVTSFHRSEVTGRWYKNMYSEPGVEQGDEHWSDWFDTYLFLPDFHVRQQLTTRGQPSHFINSPYFLCLCRPTQWMAALWPAGQLLSVNAIDSLQGQRMKSPTQNCLLFSENDCAVRKTVFSLFFCQKKSHSILCLNLQSKVQHGLYREMLA